MSTQQTTLFNDDDRPEPPVVLRGERIRLATKDGVRSVGFVGELANRSGRSSSCSRPCSQRRSRRLRRIVEAMPPRRLDAPQDAKRPRAYVTTPTRDEHFFRKGAGYSIATDVFSRLDECDVAVLLVVESDRERVYEFRHRDYASGDVYQEDGFERQRCVPLRAARNVWSLGACSGTSLTTVDDTTWSDGT